MSLCSVILIVSYRKGFLLKLLTTNIEAVSVSIRISCQSQFKWFTTKFLKNKFSKKSDDGPF